MHSIQSPSELDTVIAKPQAVVKFSAEWCGPCRAIAPAVEKLAAANPDIEAVEVDIDKQAEVARKYGISAVPTFLFFENGELVNTVKGANMAALTRGFSELGKKN